MQSHEVPRIELYKSLAFPLTLTRSTAPAFLGLSVEGNYQSLNIRRLAIWDGRRLGWDAAHPVTAVNMADINATSTGFSVEVACGGGNGYYGRIGLRISSIFVIAFGSFMGVSSI